jgi:hypothetical protein
MSRVRLRFGSALLLGLGCIGLACSHETFDLLPPSDAAPQAGMAGGGRTGSGGTGPSVGGRGGGDGLPIPDCPSPLSVDCRGCRTHSDCDIGTICDLARDYCAPYCGSGFPRCTDPPICDPFRDICVECTSNVHCTPLVCERERGKCITPPPPECTTDSPCMSPAEPVCDNGFCRPCEENFECAPNVPVCDRGFCRPCEVSFECAPNVPVCDRGFCRPCELSSECAINVPVCDRGFCRPCETSFDCAPDFRCVPGGRCEPEI